jgi:hypothetical protein
MRSIAHSTSDQIAATRPIALLSTRPKPHEEMKLGEGKAKVKASHKGKSAPRKSKSGEA